MATTSSTLLTDSFLASHFAKELAAFRARGDDAACLERLRRWASRDKQKETTAEGELIDVFFRQMWGYWGAGARPKTDGYSLYPKFPIGRAGQAGGTGQADLALGWFGREDVAPVPQVVSEFKDVRSGLDAPQRRKGNDRSPVKQAADYLKEASRALYGSETVLPTWALVTDMNEFQKSALRLGSEVPHANAAERQQVGKLAQELQRLHTERRDRGVEIDRRLASAQTTAANIKEPWLWADVGDVALWRVKAPAELRGTARTAWAKAEHERRILARREPVERRLRVGARLEVVERTGELGLAIDERPAIEGVFVDPADAPFFAAQWRQAVRKTNVTVAFNAKKLVRRLLDVRTTENVALKKQVVDLDRAITKLDAVISDTESAMNELLYALYELTPEERALVEADRARAQR